MKKELHLIPILLVILAYFFYPIPKGLTVEGWTSIIIFLITIYLWVTEVLPLPVTAIGVIFMLFLTEIVPAKTALSGFSSNALFLIIIGFMIGTGLVKSGLDERLAHKILHYCKTERTILLGTIFITALLSMLMSNTATVILMLPIIKHLVKKAKINKVALFLSIAFAANIGGVGFLVGTPPNILAAEVIGWGFLKWFTVGFPFMLIMLVFLYISFMVHFKADFHKAKIKLKDSAVKMSKKEILAGIIIIITLLLWMTSPLHSLSTVTVGLIGGLLMFIFTYDWKFFQENTDWGVVFLIAGAISLGEALQSTGAATWVATSFIELTSLTNPLYISFAFVVLSMAVTQFIQNTATAAIMAPVLMGLSSTLGIKPEALIVPMAIGVSMTFLLPPGTAPNAIVFNATGIKTKEMFKAGLLPTLFSLIVLFGLCWVMV